MAELAGKRIVGGGFENDRELIRITYDFAVDGGAIADFTVLTADKDCIVKLEHLVVETAVTSAGALVLDLGKGTGGVEFISDAAVASLSINAIINSATAELGVKLVSGDTIQMGIEAFVATAGKFHMTFSIWKF